MKVALLTPCYDGRLHGDHAESVERGRKALAAHGADVDVIHVSGCPILPRARNQLVAIALAQGADQVIFVDSDVGFAEDALLRLVGQPHDIIAAAPQKHQPKWDSPPSFAWLPFADGREPDGNGVIEARGVATSFMKVRARVFPGMREAGVAPAYFLHEAAPATLPFLARFFSYALVPIDRYDPRPELIERLDALGVPETQRVVDEGEDYFFCRHAREAGFKVYLDAGVKIRHWEGRCLHDDSLAEAAARHAAAQAPQANLRP